MHMLTHLLAQMHPAHWVTVQHLGPRATPGLGSCGFQYIFVPVHEGSEGEGGDRVVAPTGYHQFRGKISSGER